MEPLIFTRRLFFPGLLLISLWVLGASWVSCKPSPADDEGDKGQPSERPDGGPVPTPSWLKSAIGYEVFVRSFADQNGDGIGDLDGITARLPYLQALHVDLLWLTPIHPSPSYHGYDITDYYGIHPELGTLESFDRLIRSANQAGIRVVLDLVVNHTSNKHPWFVSALENPSDRSRYVFRRDDPGWEFLGRKVWKPVPGQTGQFYFSIFSSALPDLNFRDQRVLPAMQDVMAFWLKRGIAGFRLDAARYVVEWPEPEAAQKAPAMADTAETHKVWRALRKTTSEVNKEAALIGEVWTDLGAIASYYGAGDELHSCFNFPLAGALVDGIRREDASGIRSTLAAMQKGSVAPSFFYPFLTNHDQPRVASTWSSDQQKLRLGAAMLFVMPGVPFLYYGEEIGLVQTKDSGDRAQRGPMLWDEVERQRQDPRSLWSYYQKLAGLRKQTPILGGDDLALPQVYDPQNAMLSGRLLVVSRGATFFGIFNLSSGEIRGARVSLPAAQKEGVPRDLLSGELAAPITRENKGDYLLPTMAPRSARWLVVQ